MAKRWKECLKTKQCDFYEAKVTCHSHWRTVDMIRRRLNRRQLKKFEEMCFGHFLRVYNLQFSGQLCHHLLLREVDIKGASTHEMWFLIGSDIIRFSKVEFGLVTGLKFGKNKETPHQISKRLGQRIRHVHFNDAKKIYVETLEAYYNGYVPKDEEDDEILKLALLLFLEVTLLGKDKRTQIDYFCMQLVDDLGAFNEFPWGSFIFARTIHSLSNCCKDRADRFKERKEKNPKHKEERYNIYGFIFAFQVWAFEAISSLEAKKHALRISNDIPRILSWDASTTPNYEDLRKDIFAKRYVPSLRVLNPTDEERQQPYFADLLDEDVPLPAELEPNDLYETAYETDAVGEDNDCDNDSEAAQNDEAAEMGDGGHVEAQETALVVRKAPSKIGQHSCLTSTTTSYAPASLVKRVNELSSEIKNLRSEMITKQEIISQLKSFEDSMMLEIQSQFASFKDLVIHTSSVKEWHVEAAHKEDDQGVNEGDCTVRDHPVEIGSDAGSHDPDESVVELDKQPKDDMIKIPRNRKRSAYTSSPFIDSTIRKQKK